MLRGRPLAPTSRSRAHSAGGWSPRTTAAATSTARSRRSIAVRQTGGATDEALLLSWTACARCRRGDSRSARRLAGRGCGRPGRRRTTARSPRTHGGCDGRRGPRPRRACGSASTRRARGGGAAQGRRADCPLRERPRLAAARSGSVSRGDRRARGRARSCRARGLPSLQAQALTNRGLCRMVSGELDEANADYAAAIAFYRTSARDEISHALIGRGDVHRERGELVLARAFYEEGLAIAERSGDQQASSRGLSARQGARRRGSGRGGEARRARRRLRLARYPRALTAQGWIALAHGERARAARLAARAEARRASGATGSASPKRSSSRHSARPTPPARRGACGGARDLARDGQWPARGGRRTRAGAAVPRRRPRTRPPRAPSSGWSSSVSASARPARPD